MKVIHIESGLGNQMLSYCEYLIMQNLNPNDKVYIENIIYDIPLSHDFICQWNGYELERIFGINAPNIKELFSDTLWSTILNEINDSKFWEHNWNYPIYFTKIFEKYGLKLIDTHGDYDTPEVRRLNRPRRGTLKRKIQDSIPYIYLKYIRDLIKKDKILASLKEDKRIFVQSDKNLFAGHFLSLRYKNGGIEKFEDLIRSTFLFPDMKDIKNIECAEFIKKCNSVAIHARRGDMLGGNGYCYKNGYFRRAVSYIRNQVDSPVFFIFCDTGSVQWAKDNAKSLALNFKKDNIIFVDWNLETESFRDMQLMSLCKHNIITNSSFGWWGAWLNTNPDKITCSPDYRYNTTHSF